MLNGEAGDEEAGRAVAVRQREQELRAARMAKLGPFLRERPVDFQTELVDDAFVLVRVDRADGVEDGPAGADALGCGVMPDESTTASFSSELIVQTE